MLSLFPSINYSLKPLFLQFLAYLIPKVIFINPGHEMLCFPSPERGIFFLERLKKKKAEKFFLHCLMRVFGSSQV